ncbi:hypothetical protein BDV59DRAFT_176883 [Aspergillus ambiguus]|uniref:uncharacterized protein n=1 Tax=Aspergillus ambiguus TaxID=176160 RepID=UPI003CCD6584
MQLVNIVLPLMALASSTFAAECYSQSGGSKCVGKNDLLSYGREWCQENYATQSGAWKQYRSGSNTALIGKIGHFDTAEDCTKALNDIVEQCHGKKNGGSWTYKASLNVNFCQW